MIVKRTSQLGGAREVDLEDLDIDLDSLFRAMTLITPGTPSAGRPCENLDAVWVVHEFTAAGDVTLPHNLGRKPVGLIQVEIPAIVAGAVPSVGFVTFGSVLPSASLVTLRCSAVPKRAAVILF